MVCHLLGYASLVFALVFVYSAYLAYLLLMLDFGSANAISLLVVESAIERRVVLLGRASLWRGMLLD